MSSSPVARSPIAPPGPVEIQQGWEVSTQRSSASLRLADLSHLSKLGVKARRAPFDVPYGRTTRIGAWVVAGSGPDEWTLIGPVNEAFHVKTDGFATVINLTHGRALMRLTGPQAALVLGKMCPIDFAENMCPDGAAFRASLANLVTDFIRDDAAGIRSYLLHCERSTGQFLFDALLDAGAEFGIEVEGARVGV